VTAPASVVAAFLAARLPSLTRLGGAWFAAAVAVALGLVWLSGNDAMRDPGHYRSSLTTFWRWPYDKATHAAGAVVGMILGVHVFGATPGQAALVVMGAGVLVELAEWYPRHPYVVAGLRQRFGKFDPLDLVADAAGVLFYLLTAVALWI
jgi:hypothetical protein